MSRLVVTIAAHAPTRVTPARAGAVKEKEPLLV
jgi:hypothetical protein